MIGTNNLILISLFVSLSVASQNKVCENSEENMIDMNAIGKCAIEEFKKSNKKEFVEINTRNRFVRKRNNSHLSNLKKSLLDNRTKGNSLDRNNIKNRIKKNKSLTNTVNVGSEEMLVKDYVRFDQVTDIPVFVTCGDNSISTKRSCVEETFKNVILDNFTYPFDAAASGTEGTVWVRFIICKAGYIKNITTKGPENGRLLEKEAKRLMSFLPKFIPGRYNNNFVNVECFMPIRFQLNE